MPFKPVYKKAPMKEMKALPLTGGRARVSDPKLESLLLQLDAEREPDTALRLECLLSDKPQKSRAAQVIMKEMKTQKEDGSLSCTLDRAVAVACGAYTLSSVTGDSELVRAIVRWCEWAAGIEAEKLQEAGRLADLMALLTQLYLLTGAKGLLKLGAALRPACGEWAARLRTMGVLTPAGRIASAERYRSEKELFLSAHGESLAWGGLAALYSGMMSGNGAELTACAVGWERVVRSHGAICGGIQCDELLAGRRTDAGIDAAALGMWAEALCASAAQNDDAAAFDAVERMAVNAIPAAITEDDVVPFQRATALDGDGSEKDCFLVSKGDIKARAVTGLARGCAAMAENAVTMSQDAVNVNLFAAGVYSVRVADNAVRLTVAREGEGWKLSMGMKQPVSFALRIRIPGWAEGAALLLNGKKAAVRTGMWSAVQQEWKDGDTVVCVLPETVRVEESYHQSAAVFRGPVLMTFPPMNKGAALCGMPEWKDGAVTARVADLADGRPFSHNLPILPETKGEPREVKLTPYAETVCRISVLPRSRKA